MYFMTNAVSNIDMRFIKAECYHSENIDNFHKFFSILIRVNHGIDRITYLFCSVLHSYEFIIFWILVNVILFMIKNNYLVCIKIFLILPIGLTGCQTTSSSISPLVPWRIFTRLPTDFSQM